MGDQQASKDSHEEILGTSRPGAGIRITSMSSASFRRANLTDEDFASTDLSDTDLSYADLSGADFTGAILRRTNLFRATVALTSLAAAADVEGAYLVDVIEADAPDGCASSAPRGNGSHALDSSALRASLEVRGAILSERALPYDLRCPSCNRYDMAELRELARRDGRSLECDVCGGSGRATEADIDRVLGAERVLCLWCGGRHWAGSYHPGGAAWACSVCLETGRMPAWALSPHAVLSRFDLDKHPYLASSVPRIDAEDLDAAGFDLSNLEFAPGTVFRRCDFSGASFGGAVLRGIRFVDCCLANAMFQQADVGRSRFEHCDVSGTDIDDADSWAEADVIDCTGWLR